MAEIAAASSEQAQGISQINTGLNQVEQVTQQNTATAEQTASASMELSGQADALKQILTKFILKEENKVADRDRENSQRQNRTVSGDEDGKTKQGESHWGEAGYKKEPSPKDPDKP